MVNPAERISIADPMIGEEEKQAVLEVLASGMLAQGRIVSEFEESFASYCDVEYAVMVNSGTAAIHSALHALGVGAGDEVITTPFTFIGTVNPILMCGGLPRFVDINPDNFNISAEQVSFTVSHRTKAILGVDLFGQPYDYEQLKSVADKNDIYLVEDACQAVGAEYGLRKTGTLGKIGAFSLYATKNIVSGEGGVLTTDDSEIATKSRRFRQHGMAGRYEYDGIGYNYRSTDMAAALAQVQLGRIEGFNFCRRENAAMYDEMLSDIRGIEIPVISPERTHVYHQYTLRIKPDFPISRDDLKEELESAGIGSGVYYPEPLHFYEHINVHGYKPGDFPEAEKAAKEVLSIPVHPKVTLKQVVRISEVIQRIADHG